MTEQEFWELLEKMLGEGRPRQVIGTMGSAAPQAKAYLEGHALLPKNYDKLHVDDVVKMGSLLLGKNTSGRTKEAIMMILAHQPSQVALTYLAKYNLCVDRGLEFFAQMALEECAMWNE